MSKLDMLVEKLDALTTDEKGQLVKKLEEHLGFDAQGNRLWMFAEPEKEDAR